jgi:hypothetical protein
MLLFGSITIAKEILNIEMTAKLTQWIEHKKGAPHRKLVNVLLKTELSRPAPALLAVSFSLSDLPSPAK